MRKIFFALYCLLFGTLTVLGQRTSIPISQTDSRFTISAQHTNSLAGGKEYYYFYVQNNTNREYKLNINITLDLACAGTKTISLISGVSDFLHLLPGACYNSAKQSEFIYSGKNDCAIPLGNKDYTLYKGMNYTISNVVDLTKQKEEAIAKKKAEEEKKSEQIPKRQVEQQHLPKKQTETQKQQIQESSTNQQPQQQVKRQFQGQQNIIMQEQVEKQRIADQQAQYARNLDAQRKYETERTEIITRGINDLGNLVGGLIQQSQADKERKEALQEQRAEEERQRQYALNQKISNRKNAFNLIPAKDIPLSSQEKATSIYFFIYSFSNLESEFGATAYTTNVFEIGKYDDGTRAYTTTVKNDIANLTPYTEILHGYYYTLQEAEQKRLELVSSLQSNGVTLYNITYKGKPTKSNPKSIDAEKQESSYGTLLGSPAKVDMRPNNGTAPNPDLNKSNNSKGNNSGKQESSYGTLIDTSAKLDPRPNNGTAPNSNANKTKENQSKNYGTVIK